MDEKPSLSKSRENRKIWLITPGMFLIGYLVFSHLKNINEYRDHLLNLKYRPISELVQETQQLMDANRDGFIQTKELLESGLLKRSDLEGTLNNNLPCLLVGSDYHQIKVTLEEISLGHFRIPYNRVAVPTDALAGYIASKKY